MVGGLFLGIGSSLDLCNRFISGMMATVLSRVRLIRKEEFNYGINTNS